MSSPDIIHVMDDVPVNEVEVGGKDSKSTLTCTDDGQVTIHDSMQASTSEITCASDDSPTFDPFATYLVVNKVIKDITSYFKAKTLVLRLGSVVKSSDEESESLEAIISDLDSLVSSQNIYCCGGNIEVSESDASCAMLAARVSNAEEWIKVGRIMDLPVEKLSQFCKPAPYGDFRKQATLIDPTVRLAMECETDNFQICCDEDTKSAPKRMKMSDLDFQTSKLPDFMTTIKSHISATLADGLPVELQQHKVNLYSEGGFFKYHVDTPVDSKHMIGSLVLCLPCEHKGGSLVVRHDGNKQTFTFDDLSADRSCIQWAAFYSSCEHKIKPVKQGNRITITYNVLRKPEETCVEKTIEACKSENFIVNHPLIKNILEYFEEEGENSLGIYLKHQYTMTGLSSERLKGCDKELYKILSKKWDVMLYTVIGHHTYLNDDDEIEDDERFQHSVYSFTYNDYLYLTNNGPKPSRDLSDVKLLKIGAEQRYL